VRKADKMNSKKLGGLFELDGSTWKIKKDFKDKKTGKLKEDIRDLILTELKPRNTIITEYFNKKKWWFEICSFMANRHNAVLRLNVIVGNPPKIRFYLWINPHDPLINVDLWSATYTDLAMSSESVQNVVEEVFKIGYGNARGESALYDCVLSGFSRGSSYSLSDLKMNNRYFLDICYTLACTFIVKNAVKHSHLSLKIGRTDVSYNFYIKVDKRVEGLVSAFLGNAFNNEMNNYLDMKCGKDKVARIEESQNIYSSAGGYYAGLTNKKTKISQVIYNKGVQLDYKLIKQTGKKGYSKKMINRVLENREKFRNIWRIEIQAYGSKAIGKIIKNHKVIVAKLEKLLKLTIRKVNKLDKKDLKEFVSFNVIVKDFGLWLHDINSSKDVYNPPPELMQLAV
jgi:hypothetical protein